MDGCSFFHLNQKCIHDDACNYLHSFIKHVSILTHRTLYEISPLTCTCLQVAHRTTLDLVGVYIDSWSTARKWIPDVYILMHRKSWKPHFPPVYIDRWNTVQKFGLHGSKMKRAVLLKFSSEAWPCVYMFIWHVSVWTVSILYKWFHFPHSHNCTWRAVPLLIWEVSNVLDVGSSTIFFIWTVSILTPGIMFKIFLNPL